MFDSIARAPHSRRRTIFFGVSAVAHGAALVAFLVVAMWRIDRIAFERPHASVAVMTPPPPPGNSGGGHRMAPPATKPTHVRKPVVGHVQPTHVAVHEENSSTSTDDATGAPGTGGGGDGKGHGPLTLGGGCVEGSPACPGTTIELPDPIEPPKPCSDPSRAKDPACAPPPIANVEFLRVSGETQIQPPDSVKVMMQREGKQKLHAAFRVCLDADGAVTSTALIGSTGYPEYDQRLADGMASWRYRPYSANGQAIAVCGAVQFFFSFR